MNKLLLGWMVLLSLSLAPGSAQAQEASPEPESGGVVCPPGVYLAEPEDCLALGPSVRLTDLARKGLTDPPRPLPASKPDPALNEIPFKYFHFDDDFVPVYGAPGEKGEGSQQFPPGFVYISYVDRVELNGVYYLMSNGGWVPGKGSRISELPSFQGLEFHQNPRTSFGWAFESLPVMQAPGYNAPKWGEQVALFQPVTIYDVQEVEEAQWVMIGVDQWLEGRKVAQVQLNPSPPAGVDNGRWIQVDLAEQTLMVYEQGRLLFATVIASGAEPFWTRPGLFKITQKKETETMRNNDLNDFYYLENVPYTMYFDGARALHGAYWRTRFGYPQSHGCVNLSIGDAHWLYNWAVEGDWVYIHDPSGLTPTDPSFYTGGAY